MPLQVSIGQTELARLLKRHDFYVAQAKARVLSGFSDIENEAEALVGAEFDRVASELYRGDETSFDEVAERARDAGYDLYAMLCDLKQQTTLGALAGCFHQWEKALRDLIERWMLQHYDAAEIFRVAWKPHVVDLLDVLRQLGWDATKEAFHPRLDATRLIVNVYKHGQGKSLDELAERFPQYLKSPLGRALPFGTIPPRYDHLKLSDAEFEDLAAAMREFWLAMPSKLQFP